MKFKAGVDNQLTASFNGTAVHMCYNLALAYQVTGDTRYGDRAVELAIYLIDTFLAPSDAYKGANQYRGLANYVPIVYDWAYDRMDAIEKAKILSFLVTALEFHAGPSGTILIHETKPLGNLAAGMLRTMIWSAIAVGGDYANAQTVYDGVRNRFVPSVLSAMAGIGRGGALPEGTEYGPQVISYHLEAFEGIRTGTGEDLTLQAGTFFQDVLHYTLHSTSPTGTSASSIDATGPITFTAHEPLPYGDQQASNQEIFSHPFRIYMLQLSSTLQRMGAATEAAYARFWLASIQPAFFNRTFSAPWPFFYEFFDRDRNAQALDWRGTLPLSYRSPGIEVATARSSWLADATWISFQSGLNNHQHAHGDVNSFQIYRKGRFLTREISGWEVPWDRTHIHNTMLLNGQGSSFFQGAPAGPGVIRANETTAEYAYYQGDATQAYRIRTNASIVSLFLRDFLFLKPDLFVVADRVRYTTASPTTWQIVAPFDAPTLSGNRINIQNTDAAITTPAQALFATAVAPAGLNLTVVQNSTVEPRWTGYKVEATTANALSQEFLFVMEAADAGATPKAVTRLTSAGANVAQFDRFVVGAITGTSGTGVTITYSYTPTVATTRNIIMGLNPSSPYKITLGTSGAQRTVAIVNGGSGDTLTTAAGLLVFNVSDTAGSGNPTPTASSLSPTGATAGGAAFTLTVNGTNFVNGAVVRWNGTDRVTTFVSATQVRANILQADIASATNASVTVFNPGPGGGTSNALPFSVSAANNPVPTLGSLSPASAIAGGAAFTLTVSGSNFVNGAVVRWNGGNRTTTFVSATQLTASIAAADIASAGTAAVTVFNPSPGGGTSNTVNFSITAPAAIAITVGSASVSLTPGGAAQTVGVTVNRTNFTGSVTLAVSGLPSGVTATITQPGTTNSGSVQLTASSGAAAVSSQPVTVTASGTGVSNATAGVLVSVTTAPAIAITVGTASVSLTPGGAAQTVGVTVNRTNFTGTVTLATSALPSGVTATITQPGTGNTGSIVLTAGSGASPVSNQAITVTASGTGVANATAGFQVSVTTAPAIAITVGTASVSLTPGGAAQTVGVTVNRTNFTGTVTLATSALPSGVTATITQPGTGNTGSIVLTAGSGASPVSNQAITVTASGTGVANATAGFQVSVTTAPAIGITVGTASASVTAGGAAQTVGVTVNRTNFTGSVTLAVSGLPSGVTATITQPGTGTGGSIVLNASAAATPVGNQTITVTASGTGVANATGSFSLTVLAAPAISIALGTSTVSLTAGGSQTVAVTVNRTNFTGTVTLATSTLPSGVTATITQPGTGNSGSIQLTASAGASLVSNQAITVTASGTGVSNATGSLSLSVLAAPLISINMGSTAVTLAPGGSAQTVNVAVNRTNFTGAVTLATSALPSGVTATITQPGTGNTGSIQLTASSSASAVSNQTVTITASGSGVTNATGLLSLSVSAAPAISLSLGTSSVSLTPGVGSQTIGVTVNRTNFTGSVSLATSALPGGVTATFTQPGTGNTGSIQLSASAAAGQVSNVNITVTGSGTGVSNATSTFGLTVLPAPAISVSIGTTSVNLTPGGAAQTVNVTVNRTNYTGSVSLATSALPGGVTATFTQPGTGNSGSIQLSASSGATQVSNQPITVTASGSGVSNATGGFNLSVSAAPAISISVDTTSVSLTPGGSAQTVNVAVGRTNFTGNVTLAVSGLPSGVTATITQPGPGNSGSVALTASGGAGVVNGQTVTVTASGTGVPNAIGQFSLTVLPPPGITLTLDTSSVNLTPGGSLQTVNVAVNRTNFTGAVTFSTTALPGGVTASITQPGASNTGSIQLAAGLGAGAASQTITVTASGSGVSSATGTFTLNVTSAPAIALSMGTSVVSLSPGESATVTVNVNRTNFVGSVALATSALPGGVTAAITQPGTGTSGAILLTASAGASPASNVTITVTATASGVSSATGTFSLTVQGAPAIAIALVPLSVNLIPGGSPQVVALIVNRTNFTGSVTLSTSALPSGVAALITQPGTTSSGSIQLTAAANATTTSNQTITVTASGTGVTAVSTPFTLSVSIAPPAPNQGGTVNGASFAAGAAVAPGSIAALFGMNMARVTGDSGGTLPLPRVINGVQVLMNGVQAPLFFVSPEQINFQVPWELTGLAQASLAVNVEGLLSSSVVVNLAATAPGIFTLSSDGTGRPGDGTGQGVVQLANTSILAAPAGSIANATSQPVQRGGFITIYCTGLGDVTNRPGSGAAAPGGPLAETTLTPVVTVGGVAATVTFSGLAPGFVGLYQVNAQVPANSPAGNAVQLVVTIGNASSNPVTIAVQ